MLNVCRLLQNNSWIIALNGSVSVYTFFEICHYSGFFLLVGSIASIDLRALGVTCCADFFAPMDRNDPRSGRGPSDRWRRMNYDLGAEDRSWQRSFKRSTPGGQFPRSAKTVTVGFPPLIAGIERSFRTPPFPEMTATNCCPCAR